MFSITIVSRNGWFVQKPCPECRHHIEKNISKLYFSFSPDSDLDASGLENKMSALTAQLYEKDIELKVSEEKRNELQIEIANIEKSRNDMNQIRLRLEKDISIVKRNMPSLKIKFQEFKQKNDNLIKDLNDFYNMKVRDGSWQKFEKFCMKCMKNYLLNVMKVLLGK
ncbi:hypothetical protein CEXT_543961 [Caerostris extrusa]|uniref:Uncharacterized protein n=1 Tax=Caerostris extrusa TaxID=172846 RepID=A0AAV4SJE7_CAEEX|nr:hypothetical protein CEXT_543961 [Caerostris extrusa]